ncbi:hypothetical protein ACP4OV_029509 [Aristida adscensionis]
MQEVIIVLGEIGFGITTQIPQYLHEAGYTAKGTKPLNRGQPNTEYMVASVACSQPHQEVDVAVRVSHEMGVNLGHEVGYSVRFDDCTTENTIIKYMSDEMLLKELLGAPNLACYSVIMIDEVYKHTLSTDMLQLLALMKLETMKRARDIRDQLEGLLKRVGIQICSNASDLDDIKKARTSGFFYNAARLQNNGYVTVKKPRTVDIHPSSGLALVRPQFVIFHEIVETTKEYMRQVTEINPEWLVEIAPHYYQLKDLDGHPTGYQRTHESLGLESLGADRLA